MFVTVLLFLVIISFDRRSNLLEMGEGVVVHGVCT